MKVFKFAVTFLVALNQQSLELYCDHNQMLFFSRKDQQNQGNVRQFIRREEDRMPRQSRTFRHKRDLTPYHKIKTFFKSRGNSLSELKY
jgi:hypothetical protein